MNTMYLVIIIALILIVVAIIFSSFEKERRTLEKLYPHIKIYEGETMDSIQNREVGLTTEPVFMEKRVRYLNSQINHINECILNHEGMIIIWKRELKKLKEELKKWYVKKLQNQATQRRKRKNRKMGGSLTG